MATIQFDSAEERRSASLLGMWLFLATEVLFFGPLFFGYLRGRLAVHEAFVSGSHHIHFWLGTANTALLLTSSLTMALAVERAKLGRGVRLMLSLTAALGTAFLCIKAYEYASELGEAASARGGEAMFYFLYFAMTGVHALHLAIGIGLVAWLWLTARRYGERYSMPVEVTGLYWHFVDIVWVFLYPMFYLLERYNA
ncbi:MAG: cytochrome c oxidase subunit 3 family protein [Betaproteobacteria bacterium]|nr:MAG: cytochrome c oxidase subunit 3 family protein [Betaproteobacteria bacterium]